MRTAKLDVEFLQHKVHYTSGIQTLGHTITVQYPHFKPFWCSKRLYMPCVLLLFQGAERL